MGSEKSDAVELANRLVDEQGKIQRNGLIKDPETIAFLEGFCFPLCDSAVEELIQLTLGVEEELTDRHIIWAVLSALLCPLHQSIGSCFATAPAILIHEEQPLQFLRDVKDLLKLGSLSRTFGGKTYTVPVNIFSQNSDEHNLLKSWEYTLASFVDVKAEFSSWNLYASLGLKAEEKDGIGEVAYQYLNEKLEESNEKVQNYQSEYEAAYEQVKMAESLLRRAVTESDIRRLKAEHQGRVYHFEACEEMRDKFNTRAHKIANFFPFFIDHVIDQFEKHFQEVYDPKIHLSSAEKYEDAPAGFRLLYKHGRTHVGS